MLSPDYTLGKPTDGHWQLINCPPLYKSKHRPLSNDFLERCLNFYAKQSPPEMAPLWVGMYQGPLKPLTDALENQNMSALRAVEESIYESGITAGIDSPNAHLNPELFNELFIALAKGLGVLRVINKEQGEQAEQADFSSLFVDINDRFTMNWPGRLGRITGWATKECFIPVKLLESTLVAATVKRICTPMRILEIGAGCGFVGYSCLRAFVGAEYHTVDLPVVSVLQAMTLASALGEEAIVLDGENDTGRRVFIHGLNLHYEPFDVAINVNSMPEMKKEIVRRYLTHIAATCRWFLSVNQEAKRLDQVWVSDLAKQTDLKLFCRSPWWCREHYVQEVYLGKMA